MKPTPAKRRELVPPEPTSRVARFFLVHDTKTGKKCTKRTQNVPNGHQNIPNASKIFQMAMKHIYIFQLYPNWDFWFENKPSGNPARHPKQIRET
jgi:hypothetical protein